MIEIVGKPVNIKKRLHWDKYFIPDQPPFLRSPPTSTV